MSINVMDNKKKLVFIIGVIIALSVVIFLFFKFVSSDELPQDDLEYFPADYSENIFLNQEYMDKVRFLKFGSEGYNYILTDDNFLEYDEKAIFFKLYFDSIIAGDVSKYITYFDDTFFNSQNPKPEKFTMQKIYDIEVLYQETLQMEYKGKNIEVFDYLVRYKIMENNGTFRKGIPSDVWKPQHYLISFINNELKILNIVDII